MAFRRENMGVLAYCNGFTMWYYTSHEDTQAVIKEDGYFTPSAANLAKPDLIFFTDSLGRTGSRRIDQLSSALVTTWTPL